MTMTTGFRLGPYEILGPLGAGGMGEVYRARDTRLGRDVAVKVLPKQVANDPDRRARFEREARAVAALSHPNIVAIFDVGVSGATAYAVTELLAGETLRERLRTPIPVRKVIDIACQIGRGLAAAHDRGIAHRDLKPDNVFLLADGQVKILDFGLAKPIATGHDGETVAGTDAGTVLGTVGYMAPEQIRGQTVDGRADLFALGVILYEMLSGRRAFQRDTPAETMTAILNEDPPEVSLNRADATPALDSIVRHCLERNPAERFQSARDLVFHLQAASTSSSSGIAGVVAGGGLRTNQARREMVAWALVVALIAALIVGVPRPGARTPPRSASPLARFQVDPPDKTSWAAPLGGPEGSNGGTISPDGSTLAFVAADAGGKTMLWLRRIDTFVPKPLAGTEGAAFPFWAPDSRSVAFFTLTRLKRIAATGGPAQTIVELSSTARGGTWNARGDILFATAGSAILRVSAEGGQAVPVTKPDPENPGHQWPSFLPDGERFLYYGSGTRAVFLASLSSGTIKRLFPSDTNAVFAPPNGVLFVREGALFAQSFNLDRSELVGEPKPVAEQVSWSLTPWNYGAFSVSATGVLTYRHTGGTRSQFAWYDRSGRLLSTIASPGDYLSPTLSPDETKVAFTRRDDQPAGDIWILDLVRQTLGRFTFEPSSEIYPVWSPDGSTIAYESTRDGLFARKADGTGSAKHLFGAASSLIPTEIVPGSNEVLFFADFGGSTGFDVFLLPPTANAKPTPVLHGPATEVEAHMSPDRKWIAYASTEAGAYEVFVQPYPATGARWQISSGGGRQPMWRQDGRELYFVTDDRKFYAVDIRAGAAFDFGTPHYLFDIPANTISVRNSYVPGRDGQRFLVNRLLESASPAISVDLDWMSSGDR